MNPTARSLLERFESRTAIVGVVGLGYVGLPLALSFAEASFRVIGFDVDPNKVEAIQERRCYIEHLDGSRVGKAVANGNLTATTDFERLDEPDAILICVPTPLTPQRAPDTSYVERTAALIAERLRPGQLVVLESTTYPGTTDELVRQTLEGSGLSCGEQIFLAFSPEREDPGNPDYSTTTIPKVVGGVEPVSGDLAEALYAQVICRCVRLTSARAAEATKLTENIYRAVNIALVNELKVVYDRMGIDVWEVLDAAATKPFGFMRFSPGPGWGGHCIPVDPFYLSWKAREHGLTARFIELAGEVNVEMTEHVVHKVQLALNSRAKAVKGSRILVLGIAYKKDIDDPRESPAFDIMSQLIDLGAEVAYHDPHIPVAPRMRSWPDLPELRSEPLSAAMLAAVDAVLIVTDHSAVDYEAVLANAPLVIDTRGVFRGQHPTVVRA